MYFFGAFDEVGCSALHGGVDGGAFGSGAGVGVFVADVGQVEAAAGQGLDEALDCGLFFGALHVFGNAGAAGDEGFGGQAAYTQRLGEAVLPRAVNQTEADGFGRVWL